jgi:hypothetical protein
MPEIPEYVDGLLNLSGAEPLVEKTLAAAASRPVFLSDSRVDFGKIRAAAAIALHMHQPLIPAGGGDLLAAAIN